MALQFPDPVIIDMERGSECYSDKFQFKVFHTTDPDAVKSGIEWLIKNPTDRQTIILDSMTEYWSALQLKWTEIFLRRNQGRGNKEEYYDLQPRDWGQIKADFKGFLRLLLALDMNVICTCRVKDIYSEEVMLKKVGETFDSDRSLPYLFDTVIRLDRTDGRYIARVEKDRTGSLPQVFDLSYLIFAVAFDLDGWENLAIPDIYLPNGLKGKGITGVMLATSDPATEFDGKERKFVGRQLLHMWEHDDNNDIVRLLGKKLLKKYPSTKEENSTPKEQEPAQEKTKSPIPIPDVSQANWYKNKIRSTSTGELTWEEAALNAILPDGKTEGRAYLKRLSNWKKYPEVAEVASMALNITGNIQDPEPEWAPKPSEAPF